MYLQRIAIANFRGIRRLEIDLRPDATVLIGENAWGKSSLLRALWMVLGQGGELCRFEEQDLYVPLEEQPSDADDVDADAIVIRLDFREPACGVLERSSRLQRLGAAWQRGPGGLHCVHWRVRAALSGGRFVTEHRLVDRQDRELEVAHEELIRILIAMNPVFRLRDSRMFGAPAPSAASGGEGLGEAGGEDTRLLDAARRLLSRAAGDVTARDMDGACQALDGIFSRYLSGYSAPRLLRRRGGRQRTVRDMVSQPLSVDSLESLRRSLAAPGMSHTKIILSLIAGAMLQAGGGRSLERRARPIVVFEDIEARFHPTLLLSLLAVIEALPVQKIITTNSGDLLSAVSLHSLRRLCRSRGGTSCYYIGEDELSVDDQRRIAFHLRINRPMSLFARCWVLVEGETEVWLLSEMASLMGMSLQSHGIRVIEFAQCGLTPLLKLARALGIAVYVLTDGDDAGRRYAATVREFMGRPRAERHLTRLPHLDIEHYFYCSGFDWLYLREANLHPPLRRGLGPDQVIETAVSRRGKPGLALALLEAIQQQGPQSIPRDIRRMFSRIRRLSREGAASA